MFLLAGQVSFQNMLEEEGDALFLSDSSTFSKLRLHKLNANGCDPLFSFPFILNQDHDHYLGPLQKLLGYNREEASTASEKVTRSQSPSTSSYL